MPKHLKNLCMDNSRYQQVIQFINQGQTAAAIQLAQERYPEHGQSLSLISNRYVNNENNLAKGVSSQEQYALQLARINDALLKVLRQKDAGAQAGPIPPESSMLKRVLKDQLKFFTGIIKELGTYRIVGSVLSFLIVGYGGYKSYSVLNSQYEDTLGLPLSLLALTISIALLGISFFFVMKFTERSLRLNQSKIEFLSETK